MPTYVNSLDNLAMLKELYVDMYDLTYWIPNRNWNNYLKDLGIDKEQDEPFFGLSRKAPRKKKKR